MEKIKKNAKFDIDEVKKLEDKTKHDVVAFINESLVNKKESITDADLPSEPTKQ